MSFERIVAFLVLVTICLPPYFIARKVLSTLSNLSVKENLVYSLIFGLILSSLFTFPFLFIRIKFINISIAIQLCIALFIYLENGKFWGANNSAKADLRLVFCLFLVSVSSMVFISKLSLPAYTDSIHHHKSINDFLLIKIGSTELFPGLPEKFYHYGYHLFIAQAAQLSKIPISELMLASGPFFILFFSLGIYALTLTITKQKKIALLSTSLLSLISIFPSFAQNWGKYPTLFSLSMILFPLFLIYRLIDQKSRKTSKTELLLLLISIIVVSFAHFRSLIYLSIFTFSMFLANKIPNSSVWNKVKLKIITLSFSLAIVEVIKTSLPNLSRIFWLIAICLALFLVLSKEINQSDNFLLTASMVFGISLLLVNLPLTGSLARYSNLIDWPFYRISLFYPAGFLVIYLIKKFSEIEAIEISAKPYFWIFLFISLCLFPWQKKLEPEDRYILADAEHLKAIEWLRANYTDLGVWVLAPGEWLGDYMEVSDSGGWIKPLTGIDVELIPPDTEFESKKQADLLCENQFIIYIDRSNKIASFDDNKFSPNLYRTIYDQEPIRIVEPVCN